MVAWTLSKKTVGSDVARDYATLTLAEAAEVPTSTKGVVLECYADSDFDELVTISHTNPSDGSLNAMIIAAAPGERPVWKPTANGNILTIAVLDVQLHGLTVDGSSQPGGAGIGIIINNGVFRPTIVACEARNCKSHGFHIFEDGMLVYCLAWGNGGRGYLSEDPQMYLHFCGAAKNTGVGMEGHNVNSRMWCRGCWSLDNTGDDYEHIELTTARFCYASDTSISDQGAPTHADDIFESQVSGNLGFTDFANNDFTLAVGSSLRQKGSRFAHDWILIRDSAPQLGYHDVFGNKLGPEIGDRLDIGPHQPSIVTAAITVPAAPVITAVVAGNTQVTVSLTGDAGETHEVFYYVGGVGPTSGGTRVGNGDIVVGSLTNGLAHTFIAQTRVVV